MVALSIAGLLWSWERSRGLPAESATWSWPKVAPGPVDFRPWPEHGGRGMVDGIEPDHAARSMYPPSSMREEPAPMISVAKVAGADAYCGPARESPIPTDVSASEVGG